MVSEEEVLKALSTECCGNFVNGCPAHRYKPQPCPLAVLKEALRESEAERDRAYAARTGTEKDLVRAWTLVDDLREALSFLRVRVLEVYSGPSPLLDEAWEKSRKALAKETYEYE